MATLGTLVLEMGANVASLRRDMDQAKQVVTSASTSITGILSKVSRGFVGIAAAITSAFVAGGMKQIVDAGDKLRDLSFATGQSVEQLSFLDYAAKQSGSTVESVSQLYARFSKNLNDIANGSGKNAARALKDLGLSFEELSGLNLTQQISKIGDALNRIENPARRAALGQEIFGKAFRANAALILEGEQGVARLAERFDELGGVVTREQTDKFDELNDAINDLAVANQRAARSITAFLAPALTALLNTTANAAAKAPGFFDKMGDALDNFVLRGARRLNIITSAFERFKGELFESERFLKNAENADKALAEIDRKIRQRRNARRMGREEAGATPAFLNPSFNPGLEEGESESTINKRAAAEARETKRRNDEFKRGVEEVRNYLADVSKERERLWLSEVQRQKEYAESLRRAVETPRERAMRELNEYARVFTSDSEEYGRKSVEVFNQLEKGVAAVSAETEQLRSAGEQLGITFSSALEDSLVDFKSIGGVVRGLTEDIARLGIRMLIIEPILKSVKNAFEGSINGGDGKIGAFFKGVFSAFGGFRAGGGPVSAGSAYVVGERGAELFVPSVSGTIVPNGGGGGGVTIINNTGVPLSGRDRGNVGGKRHIELGVLDALNGAVATGAGSRELGLRPRMVSR